MKINFLGVAEVRWTGAGNIKIGEKRVVYSGGDKHQRVVGIAFDKNTEKCFDSWCPVSDRVIVAKVKAKPFDIEAYRYMH